MKCPKGCKFSICKNINGYFLGVRDGDIERCRVTEYAKYEGDADVAERLSFPIPINCPDSSLCLGI